MLHKLILDSTGFNVGDTVAGFRITKLDRAAGICELVEADAMPDLSPYARKADIPAIENQNLYSGTGAPTAAIGADGDFYEQLDAAVNDFTIYGPKSGGVWPAKAQYLPNTDYDTPINKNKADINALSARVDTIAASSMALAFARAPTAADIYPYGKEWYDTRWGSVNPLVWVSEGNGVWQTKNLITLSKIRLDYTGTRTSWTFFGGIRILKADGTQYEHIFNAGQSSSASGFPAAGQPYTGQSANPPVNGAAWLELIPRGGNELSGFSGIIANYRTNVWSTVVRKVTLTFSNGHTQTWNVNWDNANSNITNTVTGALPFPVGSIPNTSGIDAATIAQFAPTNAAFAALQATVIANTPQPPFTQHDFGEIDPIPLSSQAALAHLEGGGGYIIDATLFQDAHQVTIINTTDAPQPIATMNFAAVYIRDGAEQTIAPEPVIVPTDMAALVSVTVNSGLSYLNISFVGREEVPPVDLAPVTEQIANHASDTGLHKTDIDRQKLGLIELIKTFSTARQAPPLPTLDGGTSSVPTFNLGRSALIDGEPYRINGAGSISYDFSLATIIGRRYQIRYAFRPPATGFVILRNNGNTVNYQFNAPEFNDVHPGITVTNDGSWITLTQEFVADSIEYSSRISTNVISAAQGPIVLVESDAVLGEGGKKLLHEGDIVIPPQADLTGYAKKIEDLKPVSDRVKVLEDKPSANIEAIHDPVTIPAPTTVYGTGTLSATPGSPLVNAGQAHTVSRTTGSDPVLTWEQAFTIPLGILATQPVNFRFGFPTAATGTVQLSIDGVITSFTSTNGAWSSNAPSVSVAVDGAWTWVSVDIPSRQDAGTAIKVNLPPGLVLLPCIYPVSTPKSLATASATALRLTDAAKNESMVFRPSDFAKPTDLAQFALKSELPQSPWIATSNALANFYKKWLISGSLSKIEFQYTDPDDAALISNFTLSDFVTGFVNFGGFYGAPGTGTQNTFSIINSAGRTVKVIMAVYNDKAFVINVINNAGTKNGNIRNVKVNGWDIGDERVLAAPIPAQPDLTGINNSINTLAGQLGGMLPGAWMPNTDYYYHESVIWATLNGYTGVHIADWATHAADGELRTSRATFDATEQACWQPYVKAPAGATVSLAAQNMGNFNPIGGTGVYAGMVHPRAGARVNSFTFTFRDNRAAYTSTRTGSCTMNMTGNITRFENTNRYGIYQDYSLASITYGALVQWVPLPGGSMGIYLQTFHDNAWNTYAEYLNFTVNWVAA